jgi:hypothetical protein
MKTHRERVIERLGLENKKHSLLTLSKASGIPKAILLECYRRGIGAYKTNGTSVRMLGSFKKGGTAPMSQRLPKEMWAMARCYSLIDSALFGAPMKHDFDLHRKIDDLRK